MGTDRGYRSAHQPQAPERRVWLLAHDARGHLHPQVQQLLADPATFAAATRLLLDQHFTPALTTAICDTLGLDLPAIEVTTATAGRRRSGQQDFAEHVKRAYAYACAMCGFDGRLGRQPVGIQAAHIRWQSQDGPDELDNALALCALHHLMLDLGVLGTTEDLHIRVSDLYVTNSEAGRLIDHLADQPLRPARPGTPTPVRHHLAWHRSQVFQQGSRQTNHSTN